MERKKMTEQDVRFTVDEWELIYSRFLLELESDLDDLENEKPDDWTHENYARWLVAMKGVLDKFEGFRPKKWKPKFKKISCKRIV